LCLEPSLVAMPFRIVALRATEHTSYLKNLQPHLLYRFNHDLIFEGNDDETGTYRGITAIHDLKTSPAELYDLKMPNKLPLQIQVSAILGKNGSGKSTLLELLYLMVYVVAEKKNYLKDHEFGTQHTDRGFTREYFPEYREQVEQLIKNARIEVYYQLGEKYYVLVNDRKLNLYEWTGNKWRPEGYKPELFFYSVVVNYSLYGLNSRGNYFWLHPLFHKNDGYKTPLVLNPFRKAGVIDVNSELHLAQARVLTNLIDERLEAGKVIDERAISEVYFEVDPDTVGWVNGVEIGEFFRMTRNETQVDLLEVFDTFVTRYSRGKNLQLPAVKRELPAAWRVKQDKKARRFPPNSDERPVNSEDIRLLLAEYILTKIAKICQRYEDFEGVTHKMRHPYEKNDYIRLPSDASALVKKLMEDRSHVTLKLKQAVNAYAGRYFSEQRWRRVRDQADVSRYIYRTEMTIKQLADMVNPAVPKNSRRQAVLFIPAAMFRPTLLLTQASGQSPFQQLSSGEQQMLHSVHCLLYHLLNIDTLQTPGVAYEYVNIVLDEIELYYHPEYQRRFIQLLLANLAQLSLNRVKGLNVIFSTHSPFILSDIPGQQVLKLENGRVKTLETVEKTFGSNIHEMLAASFFLQDELIGAFARDQIESMITELNFLEKLRDNEKQADFFEQLRSEELESRVLFKKIDMIGERVIRLKLILLYDQLLRPEDQEKAAARRLIRELMNRHDFNQKDF